MSTPNNSGQPYDQRVMIEVLKDGVPRRVHVWTKAGRTMVSFPPDMTEEEAKSLVSHGLGMLRPLNVADLFSEKRRARRHIETEE